MNSPFVEIRSLLGAMLLTLLIVGLWSFCHENSHVMPTEKTPPAPVSVEVNIPVDAGVCGPDAELKEDGEVDDESFRVNLDAAILDIDDAVIETPDAWVNPDAWTEMW